MSNQTDYLLHDILWYEDLNNIYLTPDIPNPENIKVDYENNDHSQIVIKCAEQYRLTLNLKFPIKNISSIVGKQIVLEKETEEYWKVLTKDKNNKVKTDWQSLNIESCYEVEELEIENLDDLDLNLNDDLEML
jgi:hypothetical protein